MQLHAASTLFLCTALLAQAQPQTQGGVTWDLEWLGVTPTGPAPTPWQSVALHDGPISLGDGVLLRLRFDLWYDAGGFDPVGGPPGTPQTWSPQLQAGSSGIGELAGLWSGNIDIVASGADTSGTWSRDSAEFHSSVRLRLLVPFSLPNCAGSSQSSGNVLNIQPGQFGPDANLLDHSDDATVWTGMWVPDSYTPRTVTFTPSIGSLGFLSKVYARDGAYEIGYLLPVPLNVETELGPPVNVPIVPSPGVLAPLAMMALSLAGRHRRA